jgi:hypothetical protein
MKLKEMTHFTLKNLLKKTLLFFLFLFQTMFVLANDNNPKIYLDTFFFSNGISNQNKEKIRNTIHLSLYENYEKEYVVIDDIFIKNYLLNKNPNNCSKKNCLNILENDFSPILKISASVYLSSNTYTLDLNLIDTKSESIVHSESINFTFENISEKINIAIPLLLQFPPEVTPKKYFQQIFINTDSLVFPPIKIQPFQGVDIQVIKFSYSTNEMNKLFNLIKTNVSEGDNQFNKKNYQKSYTIFKQTLDSIDSINDLDNFPETKQFLIMSIKMRLESSLFNYLQSDIQKIDKKLSTLKNPKTNQALALLKDYETLKDLVSQSDSIVLKDIYNGLDERIEKLDLLIFNLMNEDIQKLLNEFNFKEALLINNTLIQTYQNRPISNNYEYIINLAKQNNQHIQQLGRAYNTDQMILYSEASLISTQLINQAKFTDNKNLLKQEEAGQKKFLAQLDDLISNREFLNEESIQTYDLTLKLINIPEKNQLVFNKIPQIPIKNKLQPSNYDKVWQPFLFPGLYHMTNDHKSIKSNIFFFGGLLSVLYATGRGIEYSNSIKNLNNFERTNPIFSYYSNPTIVNLLTFNDIQTANNLSTRVVDSRAQFSISLAALGGWYFLSIIDALFFVEPSKKTPIPTANPTKGMFEIYSIQSRSIDLRQSETITNVQYSWRF